MPPCRRIHRESSLLLASACVALIWCAPQLLAADGLPDVEDLERRVAELASSDFSVRQRASKELEAAGTAAIPIIAEAVKSADAEVRSRALSILLAHSLSRQTDRREEVRVALEGLLASPSGRTAHFAKEAMDRIRAVTISSAAAELSRLGATVMPVENSQPLQYNVQIRQTWTGGDERLSLLTDLGEIPWLSMENAPVSDAALKHVAKLTTLGKLYLGSSRIRGDNLAMLAPLTRLQYLSLKQLPIDDAKLATVPDFPHLQYLGLDGTDITDDGLKLLARYPLISTLWLDQTKVTDAGLVHLKALSSLRTLFLSGTKAAGPGLAELKHLPNLTYLSLKETKLAPDSLTHIGQIEQLETLGLDHTNITDDQLADLLTLGQLRILWLSKTDISDAGVQHLKKLRNLQVVYLHGSQVTAEGAEELRKALPHCHVAR
jgi:hypothetical protein